jgi:flagellar basal-body rod protein FlgB
LGQRESKDGRPASQGDPSTVLFDTTQLALQRAISGASARQQALSANIANADTPGYRRVDVDFHGALAAAMSQGAGALTQTSFTPQVDNSAGAVRADGNTVDIDAESAKLAENTLDQQTMVEVAQARIHILESAIGSR